MAPSAWENIQSTYPSQKPIPPEMRDYPWAGGTQAGLLKPEIVMPTNVWTTRVGSGYSTFGGTSAATPHTGGSLALLLSTSPDSTPAELSEALQTHTTDLGPAGKDNQYGAGIPDLLAAAQSIMPVVTPVLSPYGQTVNPGQAFNLKVKMINNTFQPQLIFPRMDMHVDGSTTTIAGPGHFTIPPEGVKSINWHYVAPGSATGENIVFELIIEDKSGKEIGSADVDGFVIPSS